MGQVSPIGEAHAQYSIAGLEERLKNRNVRTRARVGLYIGKISTKERLGALNGQGFRLINEFTTAVIAFPRVALSVFIG